MSTGKKIIFAMLLCLFLLAAGCNNTLGIGKSSSTPKEINIYVGTSGLTAEFVKGAPPPKVFEKSNFPILIKIRNTGAAHIGSFANEMASLPQKGILAIGREKDYIPVYNVEQQPGRIEGNEQSGIKFSIDGKTQINPRGDAMIAAINAKTDKLDPQSENKQSTITATLCYPYKTILSTTVCIDPDIAGMVPGKKVCTIKETAFSGGQGAPIAVTKIEPQMIPEEDKNIVKPQFLIFVENKGKGNPVNFAGYESACSKEDTTGKDTWNVATLRAYTSGKDTVGGKGAQLICCPNRDGECPEAETSQEKITGFIRFRDKKDFVRCTFKDSEAMKIKKEDGAFTSPLRIEIDYGYVQSISTNFLIQKPLKY